MRKKSMSYDMRTILISGAITLVLGFLIFYFFLPPINITSMSFWFYLFTLLMIYGISSSILAINRRNRIYLDMPKPSMYVMLGGILIFVVIGIINFILSPLFQASSYARRITIDESSTFTEDIALVNFNALPLLDKDSSQKLGDRVMGQMPELVSQFDVSDLYTQINYNDQIIRVTPLEYADWIKYFSNREGGVKGYITVNSVTGEATLVKLEQGMKYMPSALFQEDLMRHVRFSYPTEIFKEPQFEIDNEGKPYWIIPLAKYEGVGLKEDIHGVITVDPVTGEMEKYELDQIPTWIDHVYDAGLIIDQVNNWGEYREGFFNSIFGQKNVVQTTEGYNYTVMNDDVYLYTGLTSKVSDESNLGFILTNMRTKETKFYAVPGAEEYSAMASAEGQVQQMNYIATFPLLINLNGTPTYLISLKDNAGLVKMYAFVDVADYQKVVVTDASEGIEQAAKNYLGGRIESDQKRLEKEIRINMVTTASIDGTTYYYIEDSEDKKYRVSIKTNERVLPFIKPNDKITIGYYQEKDVTEIIEIK